MARFSLKPASVGALPRLLPMPMPPPTPMQSTGRALAALNGQGPTFASSTGRSLFSTTTSTPTTSATAAASNAAKSKAATARRRGSVAAASAPGDAAAFLKSEGLSEADVAAIAAKHPDMVKAGVDTVRPCEGYVMAIEPPRRKGREENTERVKMKHKMDLSVDRTHESPQASTSTLLSFPLSHLFSSSPSSSYFASATSSSCSSSHTHTQTHTRTHTHTHTRTHTHTHTRTHAHTQTHTHKTQVLRPKIALLKQEAGLSDPAKLGAVLSAQPRALLAASLDRHLRPTVSFFTSAENAGGLGMRRTTLARIATRRPVVLTYDKEEQILPKVQFFRDLGLSTSQIRQMVAASPDVLSIGIGNDLQPTVVRFFFPFSDFVFFSSFFCF